MQLTNPQEASKKSPEPHAFVCEGGRFDHPQSWAAKFFPVSPFHEEVNEYLWREAGMEDSNTLELQQMDPTCLTGQLIYLQEPPPLPLNFKAYNSVHFWTVLSHILVV